MSDEKGLVQQPVAPQTTGMLAVASSREAQEIQAAMIVAQKCPRDQERAINAIMTACKRKTLAEKAMYSYPRGGQEITGPSIRLAEAMAQNWGNLQFGIQEIESKSGTPGVAGESLMRAYCWDMETNVRREMTFTVRHIRDKRSGGERLTGERDIYELIANQGARRLRSCILAVIPGDVVESACEQCETTLKGGKEPLIDRVRTMITKFSELGVTQEMIEKKLMHKVAAVNETELVNLGKIHNSIRDGYADRSAYFEMGVGGTPQTAAPMQETPQAEDLSKPVEKKPIYNSAPGASNPPPAEAPKAEPVSQVSAPQNLTKPADVGPDRRQLSIEIYKMCRDLNIDMKKKVLELTGLSDHTKLTTSQMVDMHTCLEIELANKKGEQE
jgi:hypothetical protein